MGKYQKKVPCVFVCLECTFSKSYQKLSNNMVNRIYKCLCGIEHFVIFQVNIFNDCDPCCVVVMLQINMQPRVNGEQAMMVITGGSQILHTKKGKDYERGDD